MVQGVIIKALSGFYYVDTGAEVLQCRARGKFRREGVSPLVGDRAEVRELGNGEGFVEAIRPRRNAFRRPAVANVDQIVIIASAAVPQTDPYLIDRLSAIAALKSCGTVVVLNKCDLDRADRLYQIYRAAGFPTVRVSAETGEGLEELRTVLDDTWVLWWGVSNSIPMKDREDHPFWLEIYTEERIPAATFCLGSDGLLYEGKLRFRPLNADLLAALEPLAEQWEQEHKNGGDG